MCRSSYSKMKVVPSTSIYCYERIENKQLLAKLKNNKKKQTNKKNLVPCISIRALNGFGLEKYANEPGQVGPRASFFIKHISCRL